MSFNRKQRVLLTVDAAINLILGGLILAFPAGMRELLGMPPVVSYFYTTILGAVIFGVGIALLVELIGASRSISGLGLGGAVAINLCGGGALLVWLIVSPVDLPLRGAIILWIVAVVVVVVGIIELITGSWKQH